MSEVFEPKKYSVLSAVALVTLYLFCFSAVFGQEANSNDTVRQVDQKTQPSKAEAKNKAKAPFTLKVTYTPILNISLKAERARLTEIADALAKQLKTQVVVAPVLQKELISIEFSELTLEPAMQLMAPEVYIDYEINTGSAVPPKPLGVFFYPADSAEPPVSSVVPSSTQSLLIEGDTEEGVEPTTDDEKKRLEEMPLRVHFQNGSLSIKAKNQPLALVLLKVGDELGIPVDIGYESSDIINADISKLSVEDALRRLSPNIVIYMRADLFRVERRALRLALAEPAKTRPVGS